MSATDATMMQEKYADKIAKLLAKAESTTPEEAELLVAKAQELMTQYAIEQFMIDKARGVERDEIEQRRIIITGNYRYELRSLAWQIVEANGCKAVQWETMHDDGGRKAVRVKRGYDGQYHAQVTTSKKAALLEITGFVSDLERVIILETSLRIQAMNAQLHWWKDEKENFKYDTYAHKVRARQEFMQGFSSAVGSRLRTAQYAGQRAAAETEAKRTKTTEAEASESVALVLRSRKDRVQDWYDEKYGKSLKSVSARYRKTVSDTARSAGYEAGQRADVGQPRIGNRKGLNR